MEIKYLQDINGNKILPITSASAVRDANGNNVEESLTNLKNFRVSTQSSIVQLNNRIADTYTKQEVYNIISNTPETDVIIIEVPTASQSDIAGWLDANTPSGTDSETGKSVRANKLYRVPGPDNTTFSEWAWDGTAYIMLANKDYGIDRKPMPGSHNIVTSEGVYFAQRENVEFGDSTSDFEIADDKANVLAKFTNGHINTKKFNSFNPLDGVTVESAADFKISDENNNAIVKFNKGHIYSKKFSSDAILPFKGDKDFEISDETGYNIVQFYNGHIETKKFNSENPIEGIIKDSVYDFELSDDNGNVILILDKGGLRTKNFNSIYSLVTSIYILDIRSKTDIIATNWQTDGNYAYLSNAGVYGWNNKLILDREIDISDKQFVFDFSIGENGVAYFGSAGSIYQTTDNKQSLVSVNFANGTLNIHNSVPASFTNIPAVCATTEVEIVPNHKYRIVVSRAKRIMSATLYDITTEFTFVGTVSKSFNGYGIPCGHLYDRPTCFSENSEMKLYGLMVNIPISNEKKCHILVEGDSITEGWVTTENDSYGFLLSNNYPSQTVKVAGRGNGDIRNLLNRLSGEAVYINPDYVMVTIGTNDGGKSDADLKDYYQQIVDYVCIVMGKRLILNHIPMHQNPNLPSKINGIIDYIIGRNVDKNIQCVRFDKATALNYDISQGYDATLFAADGTHPNAEGYRRMYSQIKIDCPELFNFI